MRQNLRLLVPALEGFEKVLVLGPDHESTLDTINNLGILYGSQGKLAVQWQCVKEPWRGMKVHGPDHLFTLEAVNHLVYLR
jgi:hypothetical protein